LATCVRFLQCAGFRFDSPSWDGSEAWAKLRNQDLWHTFQAVITLCRTENIEFLFITGDLFEQEYVCRETIEGVARSFSELDNTRIFITPGRRDPLIITSAYRLAVWPRNVHIFSSRVGSVKIPSHNVIIWGAGWTAYHQERPFLDGFKVSNEDAIQLMLLYAAVDPENSTEGFIPIRQEQISSSGLNYLALGHRDVWSGIQQVGETFWADCGSVEARSFLSGGHHGVLLGEINKESSRFEFRELGQRQYTEKIITIEGTSTINEVAAKLLAETSFEERQKDLFRIKLTGTTLDNETMVQPLQKILETEFRFIEVLTSELRTYPQFRSNGILAAKSNSGYPTQAQIFVEKLRERLVKAGGSEDIEHWELVRKIGLTALGQGRLVDED